MTIAFLLDPSTFSSDDDNRCHYTELETKVINTTYLQVGRHHTLDHSWAWAQRKLSPLKSVKQLCSLVSSTVVTSNAFNVLKGLVLGFENLTDQRLTEVNFRVTFNV